MDYAPSTVPDATGDLPRFLRAELASLAGFLSLGIAKTLEVLNVAPAKPRDGMLVIADGVNWNPGMGRGVYYYLNAKWWPVAVQNWTRVLSVSVDTVLTSLGGTVLVEATGKTITLPACSAGVIGEEVTINLTVTGTCTIVCAGSDSMPLPSSATETTVIMTARGQSLTFRCLTATTWGIV